MPSLSPKKLWTAAMLPVFLIVTIVSAVTALVAYTSEKRDKALKAPLDSEYPQLFTQDYPEHPEVREELNHLRKKEKLSWENESIIQKAVDTASTKLHMPQAILWCLLFQESRLDHLANIDGGRAASGIGQFSYFSFYEINHHLDRYTTANIDLMVSALGRDVRPIEPRRRDLQNASSYYSIPTGVLSSAAYLNNRYLHLASILQKQRIAYNPRLLWVYAAMAYNKGSRSVLSLWNDARKRGGDELVQTLTTDPKAFFHTVFDKKSSTRFLSRIWNPDDARAYATELRTHMKSVRDCGIDPEQLEQIGNF
jgi:hypothetical protein